MKIRNAIKSDLFQISEIYNQAINLGQRTGDLSPVSPESLTNWFNAHNLNKYPIFVQEHENSILGYLSLSAYRPGRMALRYTSEISFYVHNLHYRKGIASNLIEYAITNANTFETKSLFAVVMDTNEASLQILKKYGFSEWGHMPNVADFNGTEVGHKYFGLRIKK